MHYKTRKRIEFLQSYLNELHNEWYTIHSKNITGFYIARKKRKGKLLRSYAIIFTVIKKIPPDKLNKHNTIPKYFEITFPNGVVRRIATDIEVTGRPKLQMGSCAKPNLNGSTEMGTVGVYARDGITIFGLTNYHVAAWDRMLSDQYYFNGRDTNIFINGIQSNFVEGVFDDTLDVAFVAIPPSTPVSNALPGGYYIQNYSQGPFSPKAIGQSLNIFCIGGQLIRPVVVSDNNSIFYHGFKNMFIGGLLRLSPKATYKGDSGSPVMLGNTLVGIIVGADDLYSYVIPYYKIWSFKNLILI